MEREVKSKFMSMLIIFFDFKGTVHNEFVLASQTVNSAYYCDFLWRQRENVWRFRPPPPTLATKELADASWWHIVSHFLFYKIIFYQKTARLLFPPTLLADLPPLKFSLFREAAILTHLRQSWQNRRQCWTPSLNTTSSMHLQNGRSASNGAYARKGTAWRVMVASRPKVSFWPDGSTSPGNYRWERVNRRFGWKINLYLQDKNQSRKKPACSRLLGLFTNKQQRWLQNIWIISIIN
jgi:hypothetical protein